MQAKRLVCLLNLVLLLSILTFSVEAFSETAVSFHGGGVTVDLTYPEEARPNSTIEHKIEITAMSTTELQNFTVVVRASVNSSWVEIFSARDTFPQTLPKSYNLTISIPQEANGMLQCFIFVDSNSIDDLSTTLYTTLVSEPPFSELRILYYEMLTNYTNLKEDYEELLGKHNELLFNYSNILAEYSTLLSDYNQLETDYANRVSAYLTLDADYKNLSEDYETVDTDRDFKINQLNDLQTTYENLTATNTALETDYAKLDDEYSMLKQNYTDLQTVIIELQRDITNAENTVNSNNIVILICIISLVALIVLIVYTKRKKEEPYIVIRKETVNMKSDKGT